MHRSGPGWPDITSRGFWQELTRKVLASRRLELSARGAPLFRQVFCDRLPTRVKLCRLGPTSKRIASIAAAQTRRGTESGRAAAAR
eukprot:1857990-Pyramimonas_sp.AAC.1